MRLRNLVLGLSFLVFLSAFSNAADLTAPYVNSSNTTTAGLTANITINFTLPSTANYSNISIEFPSSFDVSNARIQNVTAITDATVLAGDYNGQVNGQNVSFIIQNLANITGAISLNVSRVVLPSLATSYSFTIYAVENTSVMNDGPTSTLNSLTVTAANIVNVTTYVANVSPNYSLSTPVGSVFFIAAFGQDSFGNVNITQGFNFLNNNSAADSAGNILSSGNGTSYMIFNATSVGTVSFNVSSVADLGMWNSTGPNVTIYSVSGGSGGGGGSHGSSSSGGDFVITPTPTPIPSVTPTPVPTATPTPIPTATPTPVPTATPTSGPQAPTASASNNNDGLLIVGGLIVLIGGGYYFLRPKSPRLGG